MSEKKKQLKIGVVGLGLIGGSIAKAYKRAGAEVYAYNRTKSTLDFALLDGAADGRLTDETLAECDAVFLCLTIGASVSWLEKHADAISEDALVVDCCGIKRRICEAGFAAAKEHGFTFVGGHPMAGKQYGGYKNSTETLFDGATMVVVPEKRDSITLIERLKDLFKQAGFGRLSFMTADQHDGMIAFISQMTHIAANAFVKNEQNHPAGFTPGGSFRDFTRVAYLDETLWTDLIMENRDFLLAELNDYIGELGKYRDAIEAGDEEALKELFKAGTKSKQKADRKDPVLTMEL